MTCLNKYAAPSATRIVGGGVNLALRSTASINGTLPVQLQELLTADTIYLDNNIFLSGASRCIIATALFPKAFETPTATDASVL